MSEVFRAHQHGPDHVEASKQHFTQDDKFQEYDEKGEIVCSSNTAQ